MYNIIVYNIILEELQMQWEMHHNLEEHLHMQAEQDAMEYDENADSDDCVEWWQQVLLSQNDKY